MSKECFSYGKFGELVKKAKIPLSPVVKANEPPARTFINVAS